MYVSFIISLAFSHCWLSFCPVKSHTPTIPEVYFLWLTAHGVSGLFYRKQQPLPHTVSHSRNFCCAPSKSKLTYKHSRNSVIGSRYVYDSWHRKDTPHYHNVSYTTHWVHYKRDAFSLLTVNSTWKIKLKTGYIIWLTIITLIPILNRNTTSIIIILLWL